VVLPPKPAHLTDEQWEIANTIPKLVEVLLTPDKNAAKLVVSKPQVWRVHGPAFDCTVTRMARCKRASTASAARITPLVTCTHRPACGCVSCAVDRPTIVRRR